MDADMVREVEFGRKMRGYDMAEVDAFLEKMERTFRRKDLEQENLQHKLEELTSGGEAGDPQCLNQQPPGGECPIKGPVGTGAPERRKAE